MAQPAATGSARPRVDASRRTPAIVGVSTPSAFPAVLQACKCAESLSPCRKWVANRDNLHAGVIGWMQGER